ncbi:DUF2637 domain-containing protein [Streptomyces somaliensis DSM 40738]|uniref:DUF2637 domain-containing protein n=1 Tax=Streptomyces somaliensis (strain ATCC 33201 / DSM 40738 / JCM 12659 / KCTC 9044 / NCTC 11332 / NRRL B-12077 / IP 733) TaxID=1134445 RepID=A0AA44D9R8_STRE0|nr:DUF2637 domain-containing protein [Streptomyces somaliensis]MCQ0024589.1 DUF2637 domain-containing protein [Streptomyces somaliensis DSM 40738]NKY12823.1 DUF2637 domain-containing protein [Streptomyces somaliensis DSM 40738]
MRVHLARVDAVLVQAVIAAALSFAHLHDLASAAGQDGWKAWAYPVSVDLLLVAAWRRLRTGEAKAAGWCWFVIALAASLGANVATAGLLDMDQVPAWLRILVAGWPAVAFLGGTLLAHSPPPTADKETESAQRDEDIEDQEDDPEPPPEEPSTRPAAVEAPPARPAVAVPAALVEHARKVAAEHHARTGTPIDTPTLRARLGVPAPLAEAIAAHL